MRLHLTVLLCFVAIVTSCKPRSSFSLFQRSVLANPNLDDARQLYLLGGILTNATLAPNAYGLMHFIRYQSIPVSASEESPMWGSVLPDAHMVGTGGWTLCD